MRFLGGGIGFAPHKRKGCGRDRNPLNSLGAGGRNRTVDLLITNQMARQANYLILRVFFGCLRRPGLLDP